MSYSTKKYKYSIEKKQYDRREKSGHLIARCPDGFYNILLFDLTA